MKSMLPILVGLAFATAAIGDEKAWETARRTGLSQWQQGYYGHAESCLAQAANAAKAFGARDPRWAETLLELARMQLFNGTYVKAQRHAAKAQRVLEKLHGDGHISVAPALRIRAETARALGDPGAEQLAVEALKICLKHADEQPLLLAEAYETLARVGRPYERSAHSAAWPVKAPVLPKALAIREKLFGKSSLQLLPWFLVDRDGEHWHRESIPDPRDNLERAKAIVSKHRESDSHSDMAEVLTRLAQVDLTHARASNADVSEADKLIAEALSIWRVHETPLPPRSSPTWRTLGELRLAQKRFSDAERAFATALQAHFTRVSDEELCDACVRAKSTLHRWRRPFINQDSYLTEMARRGGADIELFLRKRFAELSKEAKKTDHDANNIEILLALRRIQRKPDPLQITYSGHEDVECVFPILPRFDVTIANEDTEPVAFTFGGDYRSGRLDRWRFDVHDAKGRLIEVIHREAAIGGGLYHRAQLKPGDSWSCALDMNSYIRLTPGTYMVRILYHDHTTIADIPLATGLMTSRSKPFRLHVQPRVVDVTAEETRILSALVPLLEKKGPIKMIGGKYDKAAHHFVAPDSVAGMLLAFGWKAVPFLIDELDEPALTPIQRAWAFGLLYDITRQGNPGTEVLGDYRYLPWETDVPDQNERPTREYKIDPEKQQACVRRWLEFRRHLVVRTVDAH